ncbi:MAG: NAD-dependent epimerase/dehydratase family protein [Candidatus Bathyarchaeia archaeon]|jgi:nucleoside-diphosphate-sugar epimerase
MKIMITGGAGFIGSYLCEKYATEGHVVLCLDNFMTGNLGNIRGLLNHRNFKRARTLGLKSGQNTHSVYHSRLRER